MLPVPFAAASSFPPLPWGITQALSFALFRTYAVPSIGELLYATGQFTEQTQKRYDDTVLLLDSRYSFDVADGTTPDPASQGHRRQHIVVYGGTTQSCGLLSTTPRHGASLDRNVQRHGADVACIAV